MVEILIKYGVIRSIKYVLGELGIPSGEASYPATPLSDEEKKMLIKDLTDVGYFETYNK